MKRGAKRLRSALVQWWRRVLYWHCAHAPVLVRLLKPLLTEAAWRFSPQLRQATLANARMLLGPTSSPRARTALARTVVGNCFDTVVEFGQNRRLSREQTLSRLESVSGEQRYAQVRKSRRGAILVTAHMGLFETAITMLTQHEPRVHVVFRRDEFPVFEKLRADQHARLGILEAPVDEGLAVWFRLRDALLANDVVLMQGDRVMPGQSGVEVPFLGGRLRVPTGPVKLARITGSPIVPAFALKTPQHRVRIVLEEPILPEDFPVGESRIDPALLRLTAVIERYVREFPEQWLCLHAAWCDDDRHAD